MPAPMSPDAFVSFIFPIIDSKACTRCFACIQACSKEVFTVLGRNVRVMQPDSCIGCGFCIEQCKSKAIRFSVESTPMDAKFASMTQQQKPIQTENNRNC